MWDSRAHEISSFDRLCVAFLTARLSNPIHPIHKLLDRGATPCPGPAPHDSRPSRRGTTTAAAAAIMCLRYGRGGSIEVSVRIRGGGAVDPRPTILSINPDRFGFRSSLDRPDRPAWRPRIATPGRRTCEGRPIASHRRRGLGAASGGEVNARLGLRGGGCMEGMARDNRSIDNRSIHPRPDPERTNTHRHRGGRRLLMLEAGGGGGGGLVDPSTSGP